ncbi:LysE family translocator [Saccharothrix coeruleofusca]|uniref:Lysine transporter LysE n=1 Tax=Saccharothrix coeruleofusca TaxID=33919 RepID=A0A918AM82_9PSEU|nr:LysE family translocator [Saccharothrix coeruleofusca]MBP2339380.1 threonine/homoserine/homoserine lactone efflux protein [Saccharothrix coeruleofusca]GGP58081.1 lysine transporter LysE [Saccharothrix coeruleofusca]
MWLVVFFGAAVLVALTPGANNLLGMHHAVRHGPARAATALLGRLAAFSLMVAAVVAGLGPLLAASQVALTVIKWLGVAYLVYLGVRILLSARTAADSGDEAPPAGSPLRKEFMVAITNPKALLIFTAFVPQFVDPDRGPVAAQLALLGAVYLVAEALAGTGYVVVGAVIRAVRLSGRARRGLDRGTGVLLLGMAGLLATSRT